MSPLDEKRMLTVTHGLKEFELAVDSVLYVAMKRNYAEIHVAGGDVYTARMTMGQLETAAIWYPQWPFTILRIR